MSPIYIYIYIHTYKSTRPPPWQDCNSPPRHSAFTSPKGLILFVAKLRELSGGKPVGFKLCIGKPQEFAAVVHAMLDLQIFPDFITVDGGEGGTGMVHALQCECECLSSTFFFYIFLKIVKKMLQD